MMKSHCTTLLLALLLSAAGLVIDAPAAPAASGAAQEEKSAAAPAGFVLAGDAQRGAALFAQHCATCHGTGGRGDGLLSPHLDPPPGDLTNRERMEPLGDWHLYRVIRDGGRPLGLSPVMPAFGERLAEQDLHDLAVFTRALSKPPES